MRNAESATDNGPLTTNHERFEIRLPPVAEEPRLHRRGRAHAGAGHRSEHPIFSVINVYEQETIPTGRA